MSDTSYLKTPIVAPVEAPSCAAVVTPFLEESAMVALNVTLPPSAGALDDVVSLVVVAAGCTVELV
jgi:hypothetical protein